ncbi:MAG: nuclear transport factor 2 family protein [Chloroflexi bacterium]|nr:nuclear transport factor 2 family protein [Chloroflexota bacterium]
MSDITSVVDKYIQVWNESDAQTRRTLIAQVFAEDALYSDPLASVRGRAAIDQLVAGAQSQFDGLRFSLAGPVDAHHDQARFSWHLGPPEAEDPIVIGFDVAIVEDDRIRSVYGFLDKVPALA